MDKTIYAPHKPEPVKLAHVVEQMRSLGMPTIRACWAGDHWEAIEGSHRLAAAAALNLPVTIVEVRYDDTIEAGSHDYNGYTDASDGSALVSEILDAYYSRPEAAYSLEIL